MLRKPKGLPDEWWYPKRTPSVLVPLLLETIAVFAAVLMMTIESFDRLPAFLSYWIATLVPSLTESDLFSYTRVGIVIGLFMTFISAFAAIPLFVEQKKQRFSKTFNRKPRIAISIGYALLVLLPFVVHATQSASTEGVIVRARDALVFAGNLTLISFVLLLISYIVKPIGVRRRYKIALLAPCLILSAMHLLSFQALITQAQDATIPGLRHSLGIAIIIVLVQAAVFRVLILRRSLRSKQAQRLLITLFYEQSLLAKYRREFYAFLKTQTPPPSVREQRRNTH